MATHSSILAWRIPWTEKPGGLQSMKSESDMNERLRMDRQIRSHRMVALTRSRREAVKVTACSLQGCGG